MTIGRGLAFAAVVAWAIAEWLRAQHPQSDTGARRCYAAGAALLAAHSAAALHWTYGWDHSAALADTARQTAAVTGLDWSGGLYVNYAFAVLWLLDAGLWLWNPDAYRRRPRALHSALFAVFLFMFFNAAVVFGRGAGRIVGAIAILIAIAARLRARSLAA